MAGRGWIAVALFGAACVLPVNAAVAQDAKAAPAKATTGKVGEQLPKIAGKVTRAGKEADFDSTAQKNVTVYVLVGTSCPATKPYAGRLIALEAAYAAKSVEFVFLYPNVTESDADKAKFHADQKLGGVFFNDKGAAVAKALAAKKTGEAFVVGKDGKVLYRGGIDDNLDASAAKVKFLANALAEVVADKPVTKTTGDIFG